MLSWHGLRHVFATIGAVLSLIMLAAVLCFIPFYYYVEVVGAAGVNFARRSRGIVFVLPLVAIAPSILTMMLAPRDHQMRRMIRTVFIANIVVYVVLIVMLILGSRTVV